MEETELALGQHIFPAGSGRGITQTLEPIDNGQLRRTVNGELLDLTRDENRKFSSTVSNTDMSTPTLAGIWKGTTLTVKCIAPMRELIVPASTEVELIRDPRTGTVFGRDINGAKVQPSDVDGKEITFPVQVVLVEYMPELFMMVRAVETTTDEYGAVESWVVELEEV